MKGFLLGNLTATALLVAGTALALDDSLAPEDSPVQSECHAQVNVTQTSAQPQPAYGATLFNFRVDVTTDIKECAVVGYRVYTHSPSSFGSYGSMSIEGGDPHAVNVWGGTETVEGSLQVHTNRSRVFWVTDYVSCVRCETAAKRNLPKGSETSNQRDSEEQRNDGTSYPSTVEKKSESQQQADSTEQERQTLPTTTAAASSRSSSPIDQTESLEDTDTSSNLFYWFQLFGAIVQGLAQGYADVTNQEAYRQTLQNEIKHRQSQSVGSYPSPASSATPQPSSSYYDPCPGWKACY